MTKLRKFTGHEPTIEGKEYHFAGSGRTKQEATKQANRLRKIGYSVRVMRFIGGYAIFRYPRSKKGY